MALKGTAKPTVQLKVLVIAEAANPDWVSVPLIGWSLAMALRKNAQVHIVTQIRNRAGFLAAGLIEGVDFTAIDSERLARPLWRLGELLRLGEGKGWTMVQATNALTYGYFERLIWARFGAEIEAGAFDIVHRITPLSPTISSPLAAKCAAANVPFVLGPLNGGVPWPKDFAQARHREREYLSYLRGVYKILPGRRASLKAAAAILVGSRFTEAEMPEAQRGKVIYLPENAIDPEKFNRISEATPGVLRACFVGRMVPYKGPDMLLEAAKELLITRRLHLDMIGDGPMLAGLKDWAKAQSIGDNLRFHGWLEHGQVQDVMVGSTLLAFPSIREFGGGVVLEAMALGLTPMVVDYAGPGELVRPGLGIKIPLGSRAEIIAGFSAALHAAAADPQALDVMGQAGRQHVQAHFTWAQKARQVQEVYDWLGKPGSRAPNFF